MSEHIQYEHPLNERVRSLLRLEHLFLSADHALTGNSAWADRATLSALFDLLEMAGRNELRQEISKELDRQAAVFEKMRGMPGLDDAALDQTLGQIDRANDALNAGYSAPGQDLRDDEFLTAIRQRQSVPGGTCAFDLPELHQWLHLPHARRAHDLKRWYSHFNGIRQATDCLLNLIRGSAMPKACVAEEGFFQMELDSSKPFQLIKVSFPAETDCYPEISGSKHRITIRFMQSGTSNGRPIQIDEDLSFQLSRSLI